MSEFADLVKAIARCQIDRQALPLHVVVALSGGRLEEMWARSRDVMIMNLLLRVAYVRLPAVVAVEAADLAGDICGGGALVVYKLRGYLDAGVAGYQDHTEDCGSLHELEHDADSGETTAGPGRVRLAWNAIGSAVRAVVIEVSPLHPNVARRNTLTLARYVHVAIDSALQAGVSPDALAELLRPYGPPPLEDLVERALHYTRG